MLSSTTRTKAALPFGSTQSNMAEARSPQFQVYSGLVTGCSQIPFKCSASCKSQSSCCLHRPGSCHFETAWVFLFVCLLACFFATDESERPLLKELLHATSKKNPSKRKMWLNFAFLSLKFLSKLSQVFKWI